MKHIIVLSLELNEPEHIGEVVKKIASLGIDELSGVLRVAIDPTATQVEEWLDE